MRSFPALKVSLRPMFAALFISLSLIAGVDLAWAAARYTPKQVEAYARYAGKTYWIVGDENALPAFLSASAPAAPSFHPRVKESFEINEIVGGTAQIPAHYYRVTFVLGKQGFIPIGSFLVSSYF